MYNECEINKQNKTNKNIVCTICDQGTTNRAALQSLVASRPADVGLGKHGMIMGL
jgi:hypothetical protein